MKRTLADICLTEKDFKIEIKKDNEYPENFKVKINGIELLMSADMDKENVENLHSIGIGFDFQLESLIKNEAISWYINNPKIIRKEKLRRINFGINGIEVLFTIEK